jgi:hypothetical protein
MGCSDADACIVQMSGNTIKISQEERWMKDIGKINVSFVPLARALRSYRICVLEL